MWLRLPDGETSWTVLGDDWLPVPPVEQFLEYLRAQRRSPNTVRNYAHGLARWWQYVGAEGAGWEAVSVEQLAGFLVWLRSGETSSVVSIVEPPARLSEATIALRLAAVMAFYRYHQLNGVAGAGRLYERVHRGGGAYKPFLEHIARRSGRRRAVVAVRRRRRGAPPVLAPAQMAAIKDACARWDAHGRWWVGSLRHRLLWSVAEETGMRIGEVLSLQHRDWHTGRGDTAFVEVVPREHPHGLRVKGGAYRKLYVSDELDRLYGDYLVELCERGADAAVADLDAAYVFVNLDREPRFSPMRVESVYALVGRLRRRLAGVVPVAWTPHWFRYSHATALLLGGVPVHVVTRRLWDADVQTTQNTYAWVTEDGRAARGRRLEGAERPVAATVTVDVFTSTGLDGRAGYAPETTERLWAQLHAELRLERFAPKTVPAEHRGAFAGGRRFTSLDLTTLPVGLRRELAWSVAGIIARGGLVPVGPLAMLARHLPTLLEDLRRRGIDARSLMHFSPSGWEREFQRLALKHGRPELAIKSVRGALRRIYRPLWIAYDPRPWWQREVWDPELDAAIPLRAHEPDGEKLLNFLRLEQGWLRAGAQWYFKVSLELERLTWSTLRGYLNALAELSGFLDARGVEDPWLRERPAEVRVLMLDFLGELKARKVKRGPTKGRPLSGAQVANHMVGIEGFYRFMHDEREQAAAALDDRRWLRLGPEHTRFWRYGEKPARHHRLDERHLLTDAAFAQIMAGLHVLGDPVADGGLGDEQAMRALMLLARTGRRLNEILLLDFDPLVAIDGLPPRADTDAGAAVAAKLRYQQTKIDDAPDTILVDEEIVAIIRAQQQWVRDRISATDDAGRRYLFIRPTENRFGTRPYTDGAFQQRLSQLVRRLDLRDDQGRAIDFRRTHRLRHTRATSLLNAGVPLHVVQRYLGHLSPRMTMHYAQTLAATHEREFLRFHKITADARELALDPRDLYDLLELDQRADRVLPNGYCMLPPRQVCDRGNACLTCDKFATDATFLSEHEDQLGRLVDLVEHRQQAFAERTGQAMSSEHVWLQQRRREQRALHAIIARLKQPELSGSAVRGAGTDARTDPVDG